MTVRRKLVRALVWASTIAFGLPLVLWASSETYFRYSYCQGRDLVFLTRAREPEPWVYVYADDWSIPQWTPDGAAILFASARDRQSGYEVFVVASDGSEPLNSFGDRGVAGFQLAPDGSHIAHGTGQIEVSALDRSGRRRLTKGPDKDHSPLWSPDGEYIAFGRSGEDRCRLLFFTHNASGLYTMKSDGSDVRRIASTYRGVMEWSQDGRLAFVTERALHTVKANGRDRRTVYNLPEESKGSPIDNHAWSRDGRLAFVGFLEDERGVLQQAVYAVGANGSDLTSVYGPQQEKELSLASNLAWSPDGRRIAFLVRVGGAVKLYTIGHDGSDHRQTAEGFGLGVKHGSVSWSPDGSRILISKSDDLSVVDADGSTHRRVGIGSRSAWSPDGSRIAAVRFEDDGSHAVLYTMAPDGSDVRILVRRTSGYLEALGPEERR